MGTVLIVDDSSAQRSALRATLVEADIFEKYLEAGDGIQALRMLVSEEIDLVLCDVEMPGFEGEKLVLMSESAVGRRIPFLMLTGVTDRERCTRLLRQGARDVISKPFQPDDLVARVELHLELSRLQSELEEKNRQLEHLSTTDPLTGLANRRELDLTLELEFKRASRFGTPLSVIMADLDHFKHINDTHGHQNGDAVLRHVGRLVSSRVRETDVAVRYGGEEFALVVAAPAEGARVLAETWRAEVEAAQIEREDGGVLEVTISIGIASLDGDVEDPQQLLGAADAALYRAKQAGRNRVVCSADPDDPPG